MDRLTSREMHRPGRIESRVSSIATPYLPHYVANPISIYSGPASIIWAGSTYPVEIDSTIEFMPRPRVTARIRDGTVPFEVGQNSAAVLTVDASHESYSCTLLGSSQVVSLQSEDPGRSPKFQSLRFHLFNFPDFFWKTGVSRGKIQPIEAAFGRYRLSIQGSELNSAIRSKAESDHSYLLTHVAEVRATDGKSLRPTDWGQLSEFLYYVFGFCASYRCPPAIVEGLDDTGRVIWRDQSLGRLSHTRHHSHWFPRPYPRLIGELIETSWQLWQVDARREEIQRTFEWYWESADREISIETRIVLAQVALELLSFITMVEDHPRLTRSGFESLSAADRILLLANQLQASASFPQAFQKLLEAAPQRRNEPLPTVPVALMTIRKAIVQPGKLGRKAKVALDSKSKHQATEWAVWLVELGILNLLKYRGRYDSRIADPEQCFPFVPWADPFQSGAPGTEPA